MYNLVRQGRMQKDNDLEFLLGKIVRKYINVVFLFHSLNNIFIHHITYEVITNESETHNIPITQCC